MKTKREMPLAEALEEISSTVQRLKDEGRARVNGTEVKLDEPVTLEIETEAKKGKAELEFEIKWPAGKGNRGEKEKAHSGGGRRRLLFLTVLGVALGAAAMMVMRRRHQAEEEDEL